MLQGVRLSSFHLLLMSSTWRWHSHPLDQKVWFTTSLLFSKISLSCGLERLSIMHPGSSDIVTFKLGWMMMFWACFHRVRQQFDARDQCPKQQLWLWLRRRKKGLYAHGVCRCETWEQLSLLVGTNPWAVVHWVCKVGPVVRCMVMSQALAKFGMCGCRVRHKAVRFCCEDVWWALQTKHVFHSLYFQIVVEHTVGMITCSWYVPPSGFLVNEFHDLCCAVSQFAKPKPGDFQRALTNK